ncbi:MAG: TIGR02710 family CRISPR-associated protein [Clostridiaceae bacterium]|jgi:CRISPR-associated protein (TIGR02710 family)|nr:TIGR02710 family CRISPR-associated protein [Clostridiaceae bacterium]
MNIKRCLLMTVGGTPTQTIKSIEFNKPEYAIFFCSDQTYSIAKEVVDNLGEGYKLKDFERITTSDAEILSESYLTLVHELPGKLKRFNLSMDDVTVDYTGGTKSMVAALVLATINQCKTYSYIGGESRSKDGVGIVLDGKERFFYQDNPWNSLAVSELPVIDMLFNRARYASLSEKLQDMSARMDGQHKNFYADLSKIVKAYDAWDNFRYSEARNGFKVFEKWQRFQIINNPHLNELMNTIGRNIEWLNSFLDMKSNSIEFFDSQFLDLVSNALRRAGLEEKYDDAVVRLYSAIEKYAKARLLQYGINNSRTMASQIPEELASRFACMPHKTDDKTGEVYYEYGFDLSCRMLCLKDTDFCVRYRNNEEKMKKLMYARNNAILVHGLSPIKKPTYEAMLELVLDFSNLNTKQLISFPQMNSQMWGPVLKGVG